MPIMDEKNKPRLLLIFLHGFGDNIMATPAVRQLASHYLIDIMVYDKTNSQQLWSELSYVNDVISLRLPAHPRYWNPVIFWIKDFWIVTLKILPYIRNRNYKKIIFSKIYIFPHVIYDTFPFLLSRYHKIDQIAYDLGITALISKKTDIQIPSDARLFADAFFKSRELCSKNIIVSIHMTTTEWQRDLDLELVQKVVDQISVELPNILFVMLGTPQSYKDEQLRYGCHVVGSNVIYTFNSEEGIDIMHSAAIIAKSKLFVGIDSSMLHCAGALAVRTVAVFRTKKIKPDQRVAFNSNITSLYCEEVNYNRLLESIKAHLIK